MVRETVLLLAELVVLFFGVAFLVDLSQRWLGPDRLRRWMGGPPIAAAMKGIGIGFVTPFCTFSAIPVLMGLRQAGVTPAGYVAFISAAPVLDPVLFGALVVIVGYQAAQMYVAVAFVAAISLALLAEKVDIVRHLKPVPVLVPSRSGATGRTDLACGAVEVSELWRGWRIEAHASSLAAWSLLRSMAPLLGFGVGVGVVIEILISPETAAAITGGSSVFAIPVAAALGTPLYFSTELFVPIADSLSSAGVGVGVIVALTIAGAGANIPEFILLGRMANARVLAVFVTYVFVVAMIGGWLAALVAA